MASALRVAAVAPASAPVARRSTFVKGARALKIAPRPRLRARRRPRGPRARGRRARQRPAGGGVERGSGFEVHKFGGTCVGSSERISGCCDLLIESAKSGVKTFGIVSAMGVATKGEPKVTDCLISATDMAAARDPRGSRSSSSSSTSTRPPPRLYSPKRLSTTHT